MFKQFVYGYVARLPQSRYALLRNDRAGENGRGGKTDLLKTCLRALPARNDRDFAYLVQGEVAFSRENDGGVVLHFFNPLLFL